MEPTIHIKPHVMAELRSILEFGEKVDAAIPCGPVRVKEGQIARAEDRDYCLLTNLRLIHVRGEWFKTKDAAKVVIVARKRIASVESKTFLLGATLDFTVVDEKNPFIKTSLVVENCGKTGAESISKILTATSATKTCPACGKPLDEQFSFCPYCKFSLKKVCQTCGKAMNDDWIGCPYCGAS